MIYKIAGIKFLQDDFSKAVNEHNKIQILWDHYAKVFDVTQSFYQVGPDRDHNLLTVFHQSMPLKQAQNKLADKIIIKDPELFKEIQNMAYSI